MDSAIGSTPNLDDDAANNPSEAAIAQHRSYAETIGDLTLAAENASLYKVLQELNEPKSVQPLVLP